MTPANQPRAQVEVTEADRRCLSYLALQGPARYNEQVIAQHVAARVAEETARVSMLSATAACAEIPALAEYVAQVEKDLRIVTADRDGVKAINEQHRARIAELERAVKGYQQGLTTGLVAISETELAAYRERERGLADALAEAGKSFEAIAGILAGGTHSEMMVALRKAEANGIWCAALAAAPTEAKAHPDTARKAAP
jgi:hypothetical protein